MPRRKKPFIDKNNAVTFHLVHRSQRDPLQADEDAPERVLLLATDQERKDARKEEQRKYGVFFDDDYNYLQHLKDVNEVHQVGPTEPYRLDSKSSRKRGDHVQVIDNVDTQVPNIRLPSSVFASDIETKVGMLNKAAPNRGPKIDWDPDIVAALDDDFDFDNPENQLEDDFLALANAETGEQEGRDPTKLSKETSRFGNIPEEGDNDYDTDDCYEDVSDDSMSDADSLGQHSFMDEETKSRFTNYSMTSSVIRRNEGLTLLDDRFETLYEQYDDTEIGPLDHEEIDGSLQPGSTMLDNIIEEFQKEQQIKQLTEGGQQVENKTLVNESDSEAEDDITKMVIEPVKEQWDCQSILSTYSNLYNHPKLIEEPKKERPIKLTRRVGIPEDTLATRGLTTKELNQEMNMGNTDTEKASTHRPKQESSDEKKARKTAIKEERKGRREEKKANRVAFKAEKIRLDKEVRNVQQNLQGILIV